jgi:DNA repair protein RadC
MMLISDYHDALDHEQRPRERLERVGVTALCDFELVSLLIGSGVSGRSGTAIAREVVSILDRGNGPPDPVDLRMITGLGPAKVALLGAAFELARRVTCPRRTKIRLPSDVLPIVDRFIDRPQECFLTLSLSGSHEVLATRVVTVGLVNRTMVHPREVFADPLADRAAAVVLAHNHPSGCVNPSSEDREVTSRLVAAGQTLGIPVLDHVIFGRDGYFSFLENDEL